MLVDVNCYKQIRANAYFYPVCSNRISGTHRFTLHPACLSFPCILLFGKNIFVKGQSYKQEITESAHKIVGAFQAGANQSELALTEFG